MKLRARSVAVALSVAFMATACANSSAGDSGGGADSAAVQKEAQAKIDAIEAVQGDIGVDAPLSKQPEQGLDIAVMNCGSAACNAFADAAADAVTAMGWKPRVVNQGVTPQSISAAWNLVTRQKPSGVVSIGIPHAAFKEQLASLEDAGIPFVNTMTADEPGDGTTAVIVSPDEAIALGRAMADWILAEHGSDAAPLFVTAPEFPITALELEGFEAEMKELCGSCKVTELEVSAADIGTGGNLTKIVSKLRATPNINYVAGTDSLLTGLPNSLSSAGLAERVSIVGQAGGPPQYAYLKDGGPYKATIVAGMPDVAWRAVDALARAVNGESLDPAKAAVPIAFLTKASLPEDTSAFAPVAQDYAEQLTKLWKP